MRTSFLRITFLILLSFTSCGFCTLAPLEESEGSNPKLTLQLITTLKEYTEITRDHLNNLPSMAKATPSAVLDSLHKLEQKQFLKEVQLFLLCGWLNPKNKSITTETVKLMYSQYPDYIYSEAPDCEPDTLSDLQDICWLILTETLGKINKPKAADLIRQELFLVPRLNLRSKNKGKQKTHAATRNILSEMKSLYRELPSSL